MPKKKYHVTLTPEERTQLEKLTRSGKASALAQTHARILLKADGAQGGPAWRDEQIVAALDVGRATVERVRRRFVAEGLEAALVARKRRRVYERKLDGKQEAQLIALACSQPPEGRQRWSMQLLVERLVELQVVETISDETVRVTLKKMNCGPI